MTNLKSVNLGFNKFCGPAVLSILTGKNTDECANVISRINGSYNVTGVMLNDLLKALDRLGFDQKAVDGVAGASLYRTLISLVRHDGMYVVTITGHYVCIEVKDKKIYFCDNHTKEPIPAASSARLGMQVIAVHKVIEREKPPEPPKPVLVSSEIGTKVEKYHDNYGVEIYRQNTYNMEEWNKRDNIAYFHVDNIADLKTIVHSLISRLNELKGEKL